MAAVPGTPPMRSPEIVEVQGTRVMFLNAHLFKGTAMAAVYRPITYRDYTRADAIAERISESGASVVMLAEVWGASSRERIVRGAAPTHPYWWAPPRRPHGSPFELGTGLLFLATSPIERRRCTWFSELNGWDAWSQKAVASARIGGVTYACTHLDAEGASRDVECRASNMREVLAHLETHLAEDDAVVFAGDMNIAEDSAEFAQLAETFAHVRMHDPLRELYPDRTAVPAYTADHATNGLACYWSDPSDKTRSRLDYFFVRGVGPLECGVSDGYCRTPASRGQMQKLTDVTTAPASVKAATSSPPSPPPPPHSAAFVSPPLPLSDHWPIYLVFHKY